ncbi:hypothetical protein MTO96_007910 [Rhipicephalus appendiculatus]
MAAPMRYARKRRGPAASAAAAAANAGFVSVPVEGGGGGEVAEDFSNSASGGTYLILTDNPAWWRHPLDTRALSQRRTQCRFLEKTTDCNTPTHYREGAWAALAGPMR